MFDGLNKVAMRTPDFVIGPKDDPYLLRWFLIPRNDVFNIYLHKILKDDDDRALHDHPWDFRSIILAGSYNDHRPGGTYRQFKAGETNQKMAEEAHRIEVVKGPVWTLVLTGPRRREWGFHCPNGWKSWREFCDDRDAGLIGKGCD